MVGSGVDGVWVAWSAGSFFCCMVGGTYLVPPTKTMVTAVAVAVAVGDTRVAVVIQGQQQVIQGQGGGAIRVV